MVRDRIEIIVNRIVVLHFILFFSRSLPTPHVQDFSLRQSLRHRFRSERQNIVSRKIDRTMAQPAHTNGRRRRKVAQQQLGRPLIANLSRGIRLIHEAPTRSIFVVRPVQRVCRMIVGLGTRRRSESVGRDNSSHFAAKVSPHAACAAGSGVIFSTQLRPRDERSRVCTPGVLVRSGMSCSCMWGRSRAPPYYLITRTKELGR